MPMCRRIARVAALAASLAGGTSLAAQHAMSAPDSAHAAAVQARMPGVPAPASSPMARSAGGTAWQPDATPVQAVRGDVAGWMVMLHGQISELYLRQPTPRGGWLLGSVNWAMLDAAHAAAGGELGLVLGGSAEALTLGACGYPLLLAVGPTCARNAVGDFQHPHAPLMEVDARYRHALGNALGVPLALEVYGGPVGEPALGPPSYLHRLSAAPDPLAPITFHEMNPAHASDGVVTAGLEAARWKVEASAFSNLQADPERFLPQPHALNSAAARLSWNPAAAWSLQLSGGKIAAPPAGQSHHAGASGDLHSLGASASYNRPGIPGGRGWWATTAAWSRLADATGARNVELLESALQIGDRHTLFARAELAGRGLEHITIIENPDGSHVHLVSTQPYRAGELSAGYGLGARLRGLDVGAGVRGSLSFIPALIAADYGSPAGGRSAGFALFASIRPAAARARMGDDDMAGHSH